MPAPSLLSALHPVIVAAKHADAHRAQQALRHVLLTYYVARHEAWWPTVHFQHEVPAPTLPNPSLCPHCARRPSRRRLIASFWVWVHFGFLMASCGYGYAPLALLDEPELTAQACRWGEVAWHMRTSEAHEAAFRTQVCVHA